MKKEMVLYFDRGFIPSTTLFLMLLLLHSTAVSGAGEMMVECKNVEYNPDVFDPTPIEQHAAAHTSPYNCREYICKINATLYFAQGEKRPNKAKALNSCQSNANFAWRMHNELKWLSHATVFDLYKKYMEEVKPFGNDSLQEGLFLLEATQKFDYHIYRTDRDFYREKVSDYFSMNLQNFTNEIQNSEINVKNTVEEKSKMGLEKKAESLFRDIQDVQHAAIQRNLPESEYFQKKYAEMKAKMEAIKKNGNIIESYLIKSNETLLNVEPEMEKAKNETVALIDTLTDDTEFSQYQSIQNNILQNVSSNKAKVNDLLKFANETMKNISCVTDDEIAHFQSVGYEARKAMKDYKNEKEIKEAIETVKKIGEIAQKTAENAKEAADSGGRNPEALHSNGRQIGGGFEGALILTFLVLYSLI